MIDLFPSRFSVCGEDGLTLDPRAIETSASPWVQVEYAWHMELVAIYSGFTAVKYSSRATDIDTECLDVLGSISASDVSSRFSKFRASKIKYSLQHHLTTSWVLYYR
jgi:hypothetical protein